MKKLTKFSVVITAIWLGFILAISFLEAPLKFQAPSITKEIAAEIGHIVFDASHGVQSLLFLILVFIFLLEKFTKKIQLLVFILGIILLFQILYLFPNINTVLLYFSAHQIYIFLEVFKLVLLLLLTNLFLNFLLKSK